MLDWFIPENELNFTCRFAIHKAEKQDFTRNYIKNKVHYSTVQAVYLDGSQM